MSLCFFLKQEGPRLRNAWALIYFGRSRERGSNRPATAVSFGVTRVAGILRTATEATVLQVVAVPFQRVRTAPVTLDRC